MYRHIVFFRLHEATTEAQKLQAIDTLKKLGENNEGLIEWVITESLDARKGTIIIEDSTFKDEMSFQKFRTSTAHMEATKIMGDVSDWWVGDYFTKD